MLDYKENSDYTKEDNGEGIVQKWYYGEGDQNELTGQTSMTSFCSYDWDADCKTGRHITKKMYYDGKLMSEEITDYDTDLYIYRSWYSDNRKEVVENKDFRIKYLEDGTGIEYVYYIKSHQKYDVKNNYYCIVDMTNGDIIENSKRHLTQDDIDKLYKLY